MFSACLQLCLQFIGTHSLYNGCSSAQLSEFIWEDVLPYQGWAANTDLRDTIVRLLLTTQDAEFEVYAPVEDAVTQSCGSHDGTMVSKKPLAGTRGGGGTAAKKSRAVAAGKPITALGASPVSASRRRVSLKEAVALLDSGQVSWANANGTALGADRTKAGVGAVSLGHVSLSPALASTTTGASPVVKAGSGGTILFFFPTRELAERVVGFPIRKEQQEMVASFISEYAMHGWDRLPSSPEFKARYKSHLVSSGLRRLQRAHKVTEVYMYQRATKEIVHRFFPHFAVPLTEREKEELPSSYGPQQSRSRREPDSTSSSVGRDIPSNATDTSNPYLVCCGATPNVCSELLWPQSRYRRSHHPLPHYYERKRREQDGFPEVVFDLQLMQALVQSSPERRLLMQDAIHALVAAHHLPCSRWEDFSRKERAHLRRLLSTAGLRVVVASVTLRGRPRRLRLVIPMQDLERLTNSPPVTSSTAPSACSSFAKAEFQSQLVADEDDQRHPTRCHRDKDAYSKGDRGEEKGLAVQTVEGMPLHRGGAAPFPSQVDGDAEQDDINTDIDIDDYEDERASSTSSIEDGSDEELQPKARIPGSAPHTSPASTATANRQTTRHEQSEATTMLRIDPNQSIELQAIHEAERRCLSLTATIPRLRFHVPDDQRRKLVGGFLERHNKLRGTLAIQHILLRHTKVFTTVFGPRRQRPVVDGEPPSVGVAPDSLHTASPAQSGNVAADRGAPGQCATVSPASRPLRFEEGDPRLPKGLTAYAVNTVLGVLIDSPPHHAATLPRLVQYIDATTLRRRVLPFLRQLKYVHTTACAHRGKQHVGMVVLLPSAPATPAVGGNVEPLSNAAKREVLTAEKAAEELMPPSTAANGKVRVSSLVLSELPSMADGSERSSFGERLAQGSPVAKRVTNRILAARNGYARNLIQRMSRLHLELWYQHFRYSAAEGAAAGGGAGGRVRDMYRRMTLSTYVVVVGLPQADLTPLINSAGSLYGWSTALRDLPPSLYGWCMQQGLQALCACFQELEIRRLLLVGDDRGFDCLLSPDYCDDVSYTLLPDCNVDGYTYRFLSLPPSASGTLHACMRYWMPFWNAVHHPPSLLAPQLLTAQSNPSVLQVVALGKVLRREAGGLASELYQCYGMPERLRRSSRLCDVSCDCGDAMGTEQVRGTSKHGAGRSSRGKHRRSEESEVTVNDDATVSGMSSVSRRRHQAPRKTPRTEVSGPTVAEALEMAFHHFAPISRVEEVIRLVRHSCSMHLAQHPLFCVPTQFPALLYPVSRAASSVAMESACTEFNASHSGQGGGRYNRLLNPSTMHMGSLAEALRTVWRERAVACGSSLRPTSSTDFLRATVESVYAPNVGVPATTACNLAARDLPAVERPSLAIQSLLPNSQEASLRSLAGTVPQGAAVPATAEVQASEAGFEIVADTLRMIVFSDQAHYRASIAQSLLSALPVPRLVARARTFLQRLPVFRRSKKHHMRVPELSLTRSPFVLFSTALRGAPQPCANMVILQRWAREADAVGAFMAGGRESSMMLYAHPEINSLLAHGSLPAAAAPLQLLRQPTLDLTQLSTVSNVAREAMTRLLVPQLSWPSEAVDCERLRDQCDESAKGRVGIGVAGHAKGDRGLSRHHRKRSRSAAIGTHRTEDAEEEEEGGQGGAAGQRDSGDDDDDDGDETGSRAEMDVARQLYPARWIRNVGDPSYLLELPIDGPPTAEEQRAVESCLAAFSGGAYASFFPELSTTALGNAYGIAYPSIFHHLDGSWHAYMWHMVVQTVYRYILRVPGIRHVDLESRMLASGVVSQRALWAVLQFLIDRQLLLRRQEELAQPLWVPGGGVLGPVPRLRSPFQPYKRRRSGEVASPVSSFLPPSTGFGGDAAELPPTHNGEWAGSTTRNCCYFPAVSTESLRSAISADLWTP